MKIRDPILDNFPDLTANNFGMEQVRTTQLENQQILR